MKKKYTVYVDDELDEYLRTRAELEHMSVQKLIIELASRQMHKDKIKNELNKK